MQPNLAQVLNTLAHEIRTPLAVSQGYLKLYAEGRLTTPDDQQRAIKQAREALGVIGVLCADIGKVCALAEAGTPSLVERFEAVALASALKEASELAHATWSDDISAAARFATNAPKDIVRAIAVAIRVAFDEGKSSPHAIEVKTHDDALLIRAGTTAGLTALPAAPGGPGAVPVNLVRGGKGLSLIWAAFVFEQHGIQTWSHEGYQASVGLSIPLVTI